LEEKIKKLDQEVLKVREQMNRVRPNTSAYNSLKQKGLRYLKQKKMLETQRDQLMQQSFTIGMIIIN